jgi:hypothetical protein
MSVHRSAPITLWRTAAYLLDTIDNVFGTPAEIAARACMARNLHAHLVAWLIAAEIFLRRLLFLEAKALGDITAPPARASAPSKSATRKTLEANNPEDWRVSFRLLVAERRHPRRPTQSSPTETSALNAHPTRPLARRYEALLRVFRNPAPYARRLAQLIARLPQRIAQYFAEPSERKRKSGDPAAWRDIIGHESWDDLKQALNSS